VAVIAGNGRSFYTVLMTLFEQDQRLQTETITPELIDYVVHKIIAAVSPLKIILFGSFAAGNVNEDSDLDLFILHNLEPSNRQIRRQIDSLLWGRRFGIDLIVRRPEEVAQNVADNNPFYTKHILNEGKVLYVQSRETAC